MAHPHHQPLCRLHILDLWAEEKAAAEATWTSCEVWGHRHANATSFLMDTRSFDEQVWQHSVDSRGVCAARSSCTQAGAWLTTPRTTTPGHTGAPLQRHLVPGSASCLSSPRCSRRMCATTPLGTTGSSPCSICWRGKYHACVPRRRWQEVHSCSCRAI